MQKSDLIFDFCLFLTFLGQHSDNAPYTHFLSEGWNLEFEILFRKYGLFFIKLMGEWDEERTNKIDAQSP